MDLRSAISEFVNQGRALCHRFRSPESDAVAPIDLHVLKAQMHLLNAEIAHLQDRQKVQPKDPDPSK